MQANGTANKRTLATIRDLPQLIRNGKMKNKWIVNNNSNNKLQQRQQTRQQQQQVHGCRRLWVSFMRSFEVYHHSHQKCERDVLHFRWKLGQVLNFRSFLIWWVLRGEGGKKRGRGKRFWEWVWGGDVVCLPLIEFVPCCCRTKRWYIVAWWSWTTQRLRFLSSFKELNIRWVSVRLFRSCRKKWEGREELYAVWTDEHVDDFMTWIHI